MLNLELPGKGNGSVSEVLATQEGGFDLNPSIHVKSQVGQAPVTAELERQRQEYTWSSLAS